MRRDFSRWVRRRKESNTIPSTTRIEHYREGKRIDAYALDEAIAQIAEFDASLREGDEVIARSAEGESLEVFLVEDDGGGARGGRFGDRTLEAMARALGDANAQTIPHLEAVIARLNDEAERAAERHQRDMDRKEERIRALEVKIDELTARLHAASAQSLERDRLLWEREDRMAERKAKDDRLDKCIDKALSIAGELQDGLMQRHDARTFMRSVLEKLDDETHAKIAAQLSRAELEKIAELAEAPTKADKKTAPILS